MKITIQTDADFTPAGKRAFRTVSLRGSMGMVARIRWYVSGRIYRTLPVTNDNIRLTRDWFNAGKAA